MNQKNSIKTLVHPVSRIYDPDVFENFISKINYKTCKTNKKNSIAYVNIPISFDIETTSFYEVDEKRAIMYVWSCAISGVAFIGRTWIEFLDLIEKVRAVFGLSDSVRAVIYVHNLSYEFQFMRKWFQWSDVFAISERKVLYAVTDGVEFRCSYMLSGYSLDRLAKNLIYYEIEKKVGDLDYTLQRNHMTKLTKEEIGYIINDTLILNYYILEKFRSGETLATIPLTKTGYVRKFCKEKCLYNNLKDKRKYKVKNNYLNFMHKLTLNAEEYAQAKRGFCGGFTHSNPANTDEIFNNVASYDFTSSYPAVMISEKFPMSAPKLVQVKNKSEMEHYINNYACIFDVKFTNITATFMYDFYISLSKCINPIKYRTSNGRLVECESMIITLTEVDFKIIRQCYKWDKMSVANFRIMEKQYLPKPLIESVLELYQKKTALKGVAGYEQEYMNAKENLNSIYGCTVTDIVRDEIIYTASANWMTNPADPEEALNKYNTSKARFLYYYWGIWITAYARFNLWTAIFNIKEDYIYSDTDSVKILNHEKHKDYFERYNARIEKKLECCLKYNNINLDLLRPKTKEGKIKLIGVWDFEGVYSKFKTLGAKRYMIEEDGNIVITVAGLNKVDGSKYMAAQDDPFNDFNEELVISAKSSGRLTHTYIDNEILGSHTDYQGNTINYFELSAVHLEESDYHMKVNYNFIRFLIGIKDGVI